MPHNIRLFSDVGAKMSMFDNQAKRHKENQMINPFSDWDGSGTRRKLSRDDPNYGKPVEGSKTAERGRQAQVQMIADMVEMCDVIFDCGMRSPDGRGAICFGDVFRLYSAINDKCVGLLMRGRKHNILDFEGEMLFQRRDDDKMIELLLPLNTIRYKYGMPERAGCGEVRHDLLEELERQQNERQPPRTRSLEQLGLPLPQLQKSKSMELARDAADGEDGWTLTVETQNASGRMGRSAENLTRISEDEGAVGGAAVAHGEVGEATDAAARNDLVFAGGLSGNVEGSEGAICTKESGSKDNTVKWELGSDDATDNEQFEEENGNTSAQGQTKWPEITIVVEEDAVSEDVIPVEKYVEHKEAEVVQNTPREEETRTENGTTEVKGSEVSEQRPSSVDAPIVSEEAESECDFWAGADEDKNLRRNSTGHAKRSNSAGRISPSLADAGNNAAVETATKESVSPIRDVPENATRTKDQHGAEITETSAVDQSKTDGKAFSFWDVPEQDAQTAGDLKKGQLDSDVGEATSGHQAEEGNGFSFWDVEDDASTEKAPDGGQLNDTVGEATAAGQKAEEEKGFSFWDVSGEDAITEQTSDEALLYNDVGETVSKQAEEENGFSFWDASEEDALAVKTSDEVQLNNDVGQTRNKQPEEEYAPSDVDTTNDKTLPYNRDCSNDVAMTTDNEAATNGEAFSFWDVSEDEDKEKPHTVPEPGKSGQNYTNRAQHPESPDAACHERLPSPTGNAWDATSAEHPSPDHPGDGDGDGDGVGVGPRPLTVPHITVSDDSEAAPAR